MRSRLVRLIILLLAPFGVAQAQPSAEAARIRTEVRSEADGVLLVGDLHQPAASPTRVPGIVFLGVTGPNDRRLSLGHLVPFDSLARRLADQGIAVLTLDDRGVGESGGDWSRAGHDLLVTDALSDGIRQPHRVDRSSGPGPDRPMAAGRTRRLAGPVGSRGVRVG